MKVLMIGNHETVSGGITSVIQQILAHDWASEDVDMKFIPSYKDGNFTEKSLYFMKAIVKLIFSIHINKPDVVHIHMSHHGSFDRAKIIQQICSKNNIPVILHLHGSEFEKYYNECDTGKQKVISQLFSKCRAVIVLGEKWENFIKYISPDAKVYVFNNSVSIPSETVVEQEKTVRFLFLGVLFERKGASDLLQAVNKIVKEDCIKEKAVRFVIAGSGPEEEKLREYTEKNGLGDYVQFTGWINGDRKIEQLKNSDVLILPSYNEGLPIAVLEAISYGMPVISTDVGSISEAVRHNENGFLFEPGNISELTDYISEMICNDEMRRKMARESRKIAEDVFDDSKYFSQLEQLYREVFAGEGKE